MQSKFYSCKNYYSSGDKLTRSFLPLSFNAIFTANKTGVNEVGPFLSIYKRNVKNRLKRLANKAAEKARVRKKRCLRLRVKWGDEFGSFPCARKQTRKEFVAAAFFVSFFCCRKKEMPQLGMRAKGWKVFLISILKWSNFWVELLPSLIN